MDLAIQVAFVKHNEVIFRNNRLKEILAEREQSCPDYQLFRPFGHNTNDVKMRLEGGNNHERYLTSFDPASGRWFQMDEQVIAWEDEGKVRLQVATDITERKQIDEERQRVEKLVSLRVLTGGIAHVFNNVLTSIMGSLSLLPCQAESGNPNYALLDSEVKPTSCATSLTQQLLTFSKGGAPVLSVIAVEEVLREAVTF